MWLFFALLSPFFWAVVHVLDSHCVRSIFEKPWMGVITSAIASCTVFIILPIAVPFTAAETPSLPIVLMALIAGACIQISQIFYFQALAQSEAGIVAAYWNMTPALLPFASFVLLHTVLTPIQYGGIALLIAASVCFCLIDSNLEARWNSFLLMLIASLFQVAALILEDKVYNHTSYALGFLLVTVGLIITGSLPLLSREIRSYFIRNWSTIRSALHIIIGIEICNLFALATSQRAIDLGVPSLVAAVETTVPAYTFLFSLILLIYAEKWSTRESSRKLPVKFGLVSLMVIGVWTLS